MRFDWPAESEFSTRRAPEPKTLVPDGRHVGEIVAAKEKALDFMKADANPKGISLIVTVAIGDHEPVESIVPSHYRGKVEAVARAAGVPIPVSGEEWDESSLIGRTVSVETLQAVSKKGTEYVRIERWHPSPSQPLKPKPANRTPTRKADAASGAMPNDDIPF